MARKHHTPFRKKAFKLRLKKETINSVATIILLVLALLVGLSYSRQGTVFIQINLALTAIFGWTTIIIPPILIVLALMFTNLKSPVKEPSTLVGLVLILLTLDGLFKSGELGDGIWVGLGSLITGVGAAIILGSGFLVGLLILFNLSLDQVFDFIGKIFSSRKKLATLPLVKAPQPSQDKSQPVKFSGTRPEEKPPSAKSAPGKTADEILTTAMVTNIVTGRSQPWQYPPLSLLSDAKMGNADRGDVNENADIIERTLESFGIGAKVREVNSGPTVTQYALQVDAGTKLSKITSLTNDLALALAAHNGLVRIEAPIPGKNLVGIELPNRAPEFVPIKRILESEQMKHMKSRIAVSMGLDVSGKPIAADIGRMPHVLIAGQTGSGKSVCINAFIVSMLFRASPEEVKFIMVDPKRVELTQYNGIPHLLSPVIVEPKAVVSALRWAIAEMETRYKKFAELGVRNIEAYHESSGLATLPYIVIIIDELADIMLFAPAEVEDAITRLAQMARATGIHLVVSTQRPSVDVITGLIKANIPCRIAFAVSSLIDSRVIIDQPGAEKLLGRGDLLYIPPDQAKPTRMQGCFISDSDINRVLEFIKKQGIQPEYTSEVTSMPVSLGGKKNGASMGSVDAQDKDDLFDEATQVVCQHDRASASLLQRRLSIGYARAARIIDQLEAAGVVGPADSSKARDVLIKNPNDPSNIAADTQLE